MRAELLTAAACVCIACVGAAPASKQPNILYIMADDLNADWKNDRLAFMPVSGGHERTF